MATIYVSAARYQEMIDRGVINKDGTFCDAPCDPGWHPWKLRRGDVRPFIFWPGRYRSYRVGAGGPWEALFYFVGACPEHSPADVEVDPMIRCPPGQVAEYTVTTKTKEPYPA